MELWQLCVSDMLKGRLEPLVRVDALRLAGGEEGVPALRLAGRHHAHPQD
jgi:hypothetical protein